MITWWFVCRQSSKSSIVMTCQGFSKVFLLSLVIERALRSPNIEVLFLRKKKEEIFGLLRGHMLSLKGKGCQSGEKREDDGRMGALGKSCLQNNWHGQSGIDIINFQLESLRQPPDEHKLKLDNQNNTN